MRQMMRLVLLALLSAPFSVGAASAPPQIAGVGTPARCLAVAGLIVAGEEQSIRMGRLALSLGGSNGASPERTTQIETSIREAEQRRDQARVVMRRFADLPVPTDELIDYLTNNVTSAALGQELAACASPSRSSPARPTVSPVSFSRLDGQDPAGFDLGSVEIAPRDYEACRAICAADSRCMAFNVYTPPPGDRGFCWVKHTAGPTRPDPASIGGVRRAGQAAATPAMSLVFNRSDGRDAAGNDLGMIEVPARDYDRCSALCAANDRCRAFNLYTPAPHDKSFCWLKHTAGPMRDDPNSVTGVRTATALSIQPGPERWVYYVSTTGGGFGWREPPAGSIPSSVEVIARSRAPVMIAGREARWSYYTVRLDCAAQTITVTSHVITTDTGERITEVSEGPKPINSDGLPQPAGMVICNGAAFPDSRVAGSREAMIAALRGAGPSSDAPALGATDRPGSAAGSRAASEVAPPLRSAAANESLALPAETTNAFRAAAVVLVPPMTVWETDYMRPEETLYALAPDAPNAAFYRSVSRPAGYGRHEMWVVAVLRAVSTDPAGAYDLGASLYSIDCEARTTQVLRGRVYRDMAPARDTPIEPVQPLQPGTVAHQMIIQVCDSAPAPAVAGTLAEVRRRVPLG